MVKLMIAAAQRGCIVFRCNKSDAIWPAEWNCITQMIRWEALLLVFQLPVTDQKHKKANNLLIHNFYFMFSNLVNLYWKDNFKCLAWLGDTGPLKTVQYHQIISFSLLSPSQTPIITSPLQLEFLAMDRGYNIDIPPLEYLWMYLLFLWRHYKLMYSNM